MKRITIDEQKWLQVHGYKKNVLLSAEELQCQGTKVQIVVIEPNSHIKDHYHKTSREFYYVLQGECTLIINKKSQILRPGDMLLTEPGDVHQLRNDGEQEFKLLVFKTNATEYDTYWSDEAN